MAKRVVVVSDLSGEEGAETVTFAWSGTTYSVDLTEEEAQEFENVLKPYLDAAEEVTTGQPTIPVQNTGPDPSVVRKWALENNVLVDGKPISEKGRVAKPFVELWEKAQEESADA